VPLYVLALTDTRLEKWTAGDRTLHTVNLDGVYAVCERRRAAPPMTDDELRAQHALLVDLSHRVSAILPVRFGALLERPVLASLIGAHRAEICAGLDEVRSRVQMSMRILGIRRALRSVPASSGREYLEQRLKVVSPVLPPAARTLLSSLAPLVARQRQEPGTGRLLATVYHLIDAGKVAEYTRLVKKTASSAIIVTGPWPPFAFTPQVW
jgi:hypothetical protein